MSDGEMVLYAFLACIGVIFFCLFVPVMTEFAIKMRSLKVCLELVKRIGDMDEQQKKEFSVLLERLGRSD